MTVDARLRDRLLDAAPSHAPDDLRVDISGVARRTSQRRRWLALLKERPMRISSAVAVGSPTLRLAALMAVTATLLLALAGGLVAGATLLPSPVVVVPAVQNGLIAYDSSGDIWVAGPDGSDARSFVGGPDTHTDPMWSPDGTLLAYRTSGPATPSTVDIARVDRSLVASVPVGSFGQTGPPGGSWSPDGLRFAVVVRRSDADALGIVDVASGSIRYPDLGVSVWQVAWSPDGSRIAFAGDDGVFVVQPDGTDRVKVSPFHYNGVPGWSPDGRRLTFGRGGKPGPDLFIADLSATGPYAIAPLAINDGGIRMGMPGWSPDGSRLAYSWAMNDDHPIIVVVDADDPGASVASGSRLELPIPEVSKRLGWSPDGTAILVGWDGLAIVSLDGTTPIRLGLAGSIGGASWQRLGP